MVQKIIRPLVHSDNVSILNAIRNEASPDYQRRIPAATQGNIRDVLENLQTYRPLWNEFSDSLINRIGAVFVHNMSWSNPLSVFKRGLALNGGDTVEEIQTGLVRSRVYDPKHEYLGDDVFRTYTPEIQAQYHTVNRREFYPITVNEELLRNAFLDSQGGLSSVVAQLMEAPTTSNNLDEYLLTTSLFAEYARLGGYYRVHVDPVDTLNADIDAQEAARRLLMQIRAYAEMITLRPTTKYNAAHMPVVTKRDDLVLFCTPQVKAALDVNGLAPVFHLDKADVDVRIITIMQEDFGLQGGADGSNKVQAILTTSDFFVIVDRLLENTSQFNPVALSTNYFLHAWQVISCSRYANAILFWTGSGSDETVVLPDSVEAGAPTLDMRIRLYSRAEEKVENVERGGLVQVTSEITTTPDGETVHPRGVKYTLEGGTSPRTRITQTGVVVCGIDESANELTVHAEATYINPAHPEVSQPISGTLSIPVIGDGVIGFDAAIVDKISVTPETANVKTGGTVKLAATATMSNGKTADVSGMVHWSVDAHAAVDLTGTVTGKTAGTANVTAELFGLEAKSTVTVA